MLSLIMNLMDGTFVFRVGRMAMQKRAIIVGSCRIGNEADIAVIHETGQLSYLQLDILGCSKVYCQPCLGSLHMTFDVELEPLEESQLLIL